MTNIREVADKLQEARERLHDVLASIEDQFAKISPYPEGRFQEQPSEPPLPHLQAAQPADAQGQGAGLPVRHLR